MAVTNNGAPNFLRSTWGLVGVASVGIWTVFNEPVWGSNAAFRANAMPQPTKPMGVMASHEILKLNKPVYPQVGFVCPHCESFRVGYWNGKQRVMSKLPFSFLDDCAAGEMNACSVTWNEGKAFPYPVLHANFRHDGRCAAVVPEDRYRVGAVWRHAFDLLAGAKWRTVYDQLQSAQKNHWQFDADSNVCGSLGGSGSIFGGFNSPQGIRTLVSGDPDHSPGNPPQGTGKNSDHQRRNRSDIISVSTNETASSTPEVSERTLKEDFEGGAVFWGGLALCLLFVWWTVKRR
jgi:hypothetical protein